MTRHNDAEIMVCDRRVAVRHSEGPDRSPPAERIMCSTSFVAMRLACLVAAFAVILHLRILHDL
jgi:hypothetical protein